MEQLELLGLWAVVDEAEARRQRVLVAVVNSVTRLQKQEVRRVARVRARRPWQMPLHK